MLDDLDELNIVGDKTNAVRGLSDTANAIIDRVRFLGGVFKQGFNENSQYMKTIEKLIQEIENGSEYSDVETIVISDAMRGSKHLGSHLVGGMGKEVQDTLYQGEEGEMEKSRLLSLYLVVFFYRLDNAIDESVYYKNNPEKKAEVFQLFNDYVLGTIQSEEFKENITRYPDINVDLVFLIREIKGLIPENQKGKKLTQDIGNLGSIVTAQSNTGNISDKLKNQIKPILEGISMNGLRVDLQERVLTNIALGYMTTNITISSLGIYSQKDNKDFFFTFSLLSAYMQLTDDLWDQGIDLEEGQSTPYSELEQIKSRSEKFNQYRKIESVRQALHEKYKLSLKNLSREQQKVLRGISTSTTPMLWLKSISRIKDMFPE